jgi:ribonuclease Z
MKLTILGNSAGGPYHGRPFSAQLLRSGSTTLLIDCGEGTQMQFFHLRVKSSDISVVCISHLHGDHVFGLIGLLSNWNLQRRTEPLTLLSPPGLQQLIETTAQLCGIQFFYELRFLAVDPEQAVEVWHNRDLNIRTIPLSHRVPCCGWLISEQARPLNIRPEKIEQYSIHFSLIPGIKAGADLHLPDGTVVPNSELTLPPKPPARYAYCSDTVASERVIEAVRGVDVLYHESTFTSENEAEAVRAHHSTARQAAEVAKQAGVKQLLLGHFSARYENTAVYVADAALVGGVSALLTESGQVWEI